MAWVAGRHFARAAMDMPASLSGSDSGVAARVRQRMRALGLADAGITVETWRGELTLRGTLAADQSQLLASELSNVRGVKYVNNFLRP